MPGDDAEALLRRIEEAERETGGGTLSAAHRWMLRNRAVVEAARAQGRSWAAVAAVMRAEGVTYAAKSGALLPVTGRVAGQTWWKVARRDDRPAPTGPAPRPRAKVIEAPVAVEPAPVEPPARPRRLRRVGDAET